MFSNNNPSNTWLLPSSLWAIWLRWTPPCRKDSWSPTTCRSFWLWSIAWLRMLTTETPILNNRCNRDTTKIYKLCRLVNNRKALTWRRWAKWPQPPRLASRTSSGSETENTSSMAKVLYQTNKPWRSSISFWMRRRTQLNLKEHSLNGRTTKLICSNTVFSPSWSRTRSTWKISMNRTGSRLLRSSQPRTLRNAIKDGCSFRSLEETRPSGLRKRTWCWSNSFRAMGLKTGPQLLRSSMMLCLSTFRTLRSTTKSGPLSLPGMESNAERGGWQLWILPSIRSNGAWKRM